MSFSEIGKRYYPAYGQQAEFYGPDYSRQPLPEGQADQRRMLYWNPSVQLDSNGKAEISLYNNSLQTAIQVSVAGQSPSGNLLWNR